MCFFTKYSQVPPCKDCPNRKVGCHGQCDAYKRFEEMKRKKEKEFVKAHEGIGGVMMLVR